MCSNYLGASFTPSLRQKLRVATMQLQLLHVVFAITLLGSWTLRDDETPPLFYLRGRWMRGVLHSSLASLLIIACPNIAIAQSKSVQPNSIIAHVGAQDITFAELETELIRLS